MKPDRPLPFTEHLRELRNRLMVSAGAVFLGFCVCWVLREPLFNIVSQPILEALANNGIFHLTAIEISETMVVYMKLALFAGIVLASPVVFYELWAFVAPGLHPHERRYVRPIVAFSVLFFALGVLFCYRILLPFVTEFLVSLTTSNPQIGIQVTVDSAFSFALVALMLFGVVFELPLLLFFLALLGLVNARRLMKFFKYFIVLAFIVGAILTPPDPVSQTLLAVPLIVLYLLGVALAWFAGRRRAASALVSTRAWAVVGLTLLLFTGIIGYGTLLLGKTEAVAELVPADVRWVAGLRPAALLGKTDIAMDGTARAVPASPTPATGLCSGGEGPPRLAAWLRDAGLDTAPPTECVLFELPAGPRAALCRLADADAAADVVARLAAPDAVAADVSGSELLGAPGGPSVAFRAPDWLVFGDDMAVRRVLAGRAAGAVVADDDERRARFDGLRRAHPAWLEVLNWPAPWQSLVPAARGAGSAPVHALAVVQGEAQPTVRFTLRFPEAAAAADLAGLLDGWREREVAAAEREACAERAATAERRLAEQLERLAGLTERAIPNPAEADALAVRREIASLRSALRADWLGSPAESRPRPADEAVVRSGLLARFGVGGLERVRARADGLAAHIEVVFSCAGVAGLAEWLASSWPLDVRRADRSPSGSRAPPAPAR